MGNCEVNPTPKFKSINNKNKQVNTIDNISQENYISPSLNIISNGNQLYNTSTEFYKISRKKNKYENKINKINYYNNIHPIQDNNTNLSTTSKTTSKSKNTDSNDPKSFSEKIFTHNISRINTFDSIQSGFSTKPFNHFLNPEEKKIEFNKNFQVKKKIIHNKMNTSDRALELLKEETTKNNIKRNQNNAVSCDKNRIKNNKTDYAYNINIKLLKTFKCHKDKVCCAIQLLNGKIATGSYDCTIKIWDLISENKKNIKEEGHVLCLLEFEENMLLSGTNKNNINLWNLITFELSFSFKGHSLWVNSLTKLNNDFFASCSNDNQIKIWDYKNKICNKTLNGHKNGIFSLIKLKNGFLCSGGADLSIKIWDINIGCKYTLLGHKKWIKCLCQLSNGYIVSGSDDKTIKVWSENECINTLYGHNKAVRTICQISSGLFASGSFDKTIKIWDVFNFDNIYTILGHKDLILIIIRINTGEIISCSNDHEVKIWKQIFN